MTNIMCNIPAELPEEVFEDIVKTSSVRIERIISKGHTTPNEDWYDQDEHEWVLVVKGEARIRIEENNREIHLQEGDYINIPAHQRHQVSWTPPDTETIWLAVFYS
ncbi:cupin domain-containing protein [Photobacterium sp. SDRW27]|uniref:cupin domain-containing protein n=1 Tax=Photobacterium obscurum TaxID=2829490 RepID=UPI0022431BBC|nr:cupin domain-containing protein [Photobacterium obscurum]MCW8329977.1 cupin domain-containing protein [Photobacterium obscurum]